MSLADRFRAEIRLQLQADGLGEADRLRQELARVENALAGVEARFKDGETDAEEYRQSIGKLASEYRFFARAIAESDAALEAQAQAAGRSISHANAWSKAINEGSQAAGAYNRQLGEVAAALTRLDLAQARTRSTFGDDAALEAARALLGVRAQIGDQADVQATRERIADGITARTAANAIAQIERRIELERNLREERALARDIASDRAAIQSHLEVAEALDHERRAEEAAAQSERDRLQVQAALERMEKDTAAAARAAGEATVRAAKEGTAAVTKEAQAKLQAGREVEERERAALSLAAQKQRALDAINERVAEALSREGSLAEQHRRSLLGVNREQEHFNALIDAGAGAEAEATRVTTEAANARRVHSVDISRAAGEMTKYNTVIDASAGRVSKHAEATKTGADHAHEFGYGILHIAHAIQDAQYGFGAVLNNIPLVVQALGGGPGLAGTVMVAGVGVSVFGDKLMDLGRGLELLPPLAVSARDGIAGVTKALEQLEGKTFKFSADYADIRNARAELTRLRDEDAAYQELKHSRSSTQEKVSKAVKEAIVEYGGGTDEESSAENLAKMIEASQRRSGTFHDAPELAPQRGRVAALEDRLKFAREMAASRTAPAEVVELNTKEAPRIEMELRAARGKLDEMARTAVTNLIGRAKLGIDSAVVEVGKAFDRAPDLFGEGAGGAGARPVDQVFRGAMEEARAVNLKKAEKEEHDQDLDEKKRLARNFRRGIRREVQRKEEAEIGRLNAQGDQGNAALLTLRDRLIAKYATNFGGKEGLGGFLGGAVRGAIASGVTEPLEIKRAVAPEAIKRLGAGGVPEDLAPAVAYSILNRVIDKVLSQMVAKDPVLNRVAKGPPAAAEPEEAGNKVVPPEEGAPAPQGERPQEAPAPAGGEKKAAVPAVGPRADRPADPVERERVARHLVERSGGAVTHEQATEVAEGFQHDLQQGANPVLAQQQANLALDQFIRQNLMTMAQMGQMSGEMAMMLERANQEIGMLQAQIAMTRGRVNQQRVQRRLPMNTIPGGVGG